MTPICTLILSYIAYLFIYEITCPHPLVYLKIDPFYPEMNPQSLLNYLRLHWSKFKISRMFSN